MTNIDASTDTTTRAHLTVVFTGGVVNVSANGNRIDSYRVGLGDGDGPVPAATAVLARGGWQTVGAWEQVSGGISGGEWVATVERTLTVGA